MQRCAKVKNPCKICFDTVTNKTGLQCQGACKKWVHFQCLNYTPGKIQDIKAGFIRVKCPCPDCDTANKEEVVVRDAGYICGRPKCPIRIPPESCNVQLCPKKNPIPGGKVVQCPEDCPLPYAPLAPPAPPCCIPQACVPTPKFLPPRSQPQPTCVPCPFPSSVPSPSLAPRKGATFSQPSKKSQTHINKPRGSQTNCPICVPPKDLSTTSRDLPSPRVSPKRTPRGTPRGTPKGTPRETPRGTPRGTPPCQSPTPQCPPPRPQCPPSRPPCQPKETLPKCCLRPLCPTTRFQPKGLPPRCFPVKKDEDCSKSTCKDSVLNVPIQPLAVSKSYCLSYGSNVDSVMSAKIRKGSKSECGIKTPEATRQMLLGAMEEMYNTVGNFSIQFRELMCKMIEALEKN